ncbi:sugar nucleotide-binding protein [Limosilactobacillus sp. STM2_1]|uniref:dTDP-4-dehydrorhamnose reductase n=1 Tax=Limosilactobacillus rudii TaxID=2759755 RepID=A0A7W3YMZ7_9LACO|nr:sugar nucleotide-binding protein [Limosilactobacillus rudii]MBB1096797.1 sugar nucleotide-binding protein [Limosilactobacillus rudii]
MDITDKAMVNERIDSSNPTVIYHCAVYTAVDNAEAAKKVGAKLVYISMDYVFDGTNEGEYEVDTPVNPKNEYGKAKLAGEEAVKTILDDYYIIRISWVFGKYSKNFVYTMLRLAKDHGKLIVANKQFS